jgi:hypothetical protein
MNCISVCLVVFTAVTMMVNILWDVKPCSMVYRYQYSPHLASVGLPRVSILDLPISVPLIPLSVAVDEVYT